MKDGRKEGRKNRPDDGRQEGWQAGRKEGRKGKMKDGRKKEGRKEK